MSDLNEDNRLVKALSAVFIAAVLLFMFNEVNAAADHVVFYEMKESDDGNRLERCKYSLKKDRKIEESCVLVRDFADPANILKTYEKTYVRASEDMMPRDACDYYYMQDLQMQATEHGCP